MEYLIFLCLALVILAVLEVLRVLHMLSLKWTQTWRQLNALEKLLKQIEMALKPGAAVSIELYTIVDGQKRKVHNMNLKVTQEIELIVEAQDKFGNPAALDGAAKLACDEAFAKIEDRDGKKFLVPVGPLGALVVSADADGDLGEGVKNLHFEGAVNLLAGDAETLAIKFGEPQDRA